MSSRLKTVFFLPLHMYVCRVCFFTWHIVIKFIASFMSLSGFHTQPSTYEASDLPLRHRSGQLWQQFNRTLVRYVKIAPFMWNVFQKLWYCIDFDSHYSFISFVHRIWQKTTCKLTVHNCCVKCSTITTQLSPLISQVVIISKCIHVLNTYTSSC